MSDFSDLIDSIAAWLQAPVAPNNQNVLRAPSTVRFQLLTDFDKPINNERAIVVFEDPSGQISKQTVRTNAAGIVNITIAIAPQLPVWIVLPDILESWNDQDNAEQIIIFAQGSVENPLATAIGADGTATASGIEVVRWQDKDSIDSAIGTAPTSTYRSKDRSKYQLWTQLGNVTTLIRVNQLTETEKYLHFREAFEANNAVYEPGSPRNFDTGSRTWQFGGGATCNQFANFFLGYWVNHNAAFTTRASSTNFLKQLENDSALDDSGNVYDFRGFSDVCGPVVPTPIGSGMQERLPRNPQRIMRDGSRRADLHYIRVRPADWDQPNQRFVDNSIMNDLGHINIYSVADGPTFNVDHHGGIFIKEPGNTLKKLTADGYGRACFDFNGTKYRLPAGALEQQVLQQYNRLAGSRYADFAAFIRARRRKAFSQRLIRQQDPGNLGAKNNYHLRVWPLLPLRLGGYAGTNDLGNYVADDQADIRPAIAPDFHHSLSRFVSWQGVGKTFEVPGNIQPTQTFLNLP